MNFEKIVIFQRFYCPSFLDPPTYEEATGLNQQWKPMDAHQA